MGGRVARALSVKCIEGGVHDRNDHVFWGRISRCGPQRARRHASRLWPRGAADHAAARRRDPLVDGGNTRMQVPFVATLELRSAGLLAAFETFGTK